MASTGATYAGACAEDTSYGTKSWSNPGNATASDGSKAVVTLTSVGSTYYLKWSSFGFSLTAGSTIDGIVLGIERMADTSSSNSDDVVRLVKAGTVVGDDKASATTYPTSDTVATYGGASDLWGTTWTESDIENSGFGAVLSVVNTSSRARVDACYIDVYYTVPSGHPARKRMGGVAFANNGPKFGTGRMVWRHEQERRLWLPSNKLILPTHAIEG